nr:MAG TPA: hypothetical protein [Caudoviricetes sp.]
MNMITIYYILLHVFMKLQIILIKIISNGLIL